jgi:hypothetical protein
VVRTPRRRHPPGNDRPGASAFYGRDPRSDTRPLPLRETVFPTGLGAGLKRD